MDEAVVPKILLHQISNEMFVIGFVLGGVLISILVILSEVLDDRVKKPEDIKKVMGIHSISVIPNVKENCERGEFMAT